MPGDMVVLGHGVDTMTQDVLTCLRDDSETLPIEDATDTVVLRKCVQG